MVKRLIAPLALSLISALTWGQEDTAPPAAAPSSAEFDLNLKGLGSTSQLQRYAQEWQSARAAEGKVYIVKVGRAQISAQPGTNAYVDAYDLAVQGAILDAHARYVSEVAANNVSDRVRSYTFNRQGFAEAQAEAACQANNRPKLEAKLVAVANRLAAKAIEALDGNNDPSTDFAEGVRCRYESLVSELARTIDVTRQAAVRGSRILKLDVDGPTVALAVAYGQPGLELADVIRAQKPADQPNVNARAEIEAWVEKNMLTTPEVLPAVGIRSFKLSNGEWAVVSFGIAGIPHQGNMSDMALAHHTEAALERADLRATGALQTFSGASVKNTASTDDASSFAEFLDVEINNGVATARLDESGVAGVLKREITSTAKGQLRGIIEVRSGGRASELAEGNVAYAIRAWSPSLLAASRTFESMTQKNHAKPASPSAPTAGGGSTKRAESRPIQEDW
ncbi:hypothetical protein TMEC54S_03208 [Thauera mechernichensis]